MKFHLRKAITALSVVTLFCLAPAPAWAAGYTVTDLGTLGGTYSIAFGINSNGQVAGWSYTTGNATQRAFLYSNGVTTDLGTLGGTASVALGINNSGQVAGWSYTTGNVAFHAFLYSNGAMTDLGTLGGQLSVAYGINNSGQVTGSSHTTGNVAYHAFLYSNGAMTDLGTIGGTISEAFGINNNGQVVGLAYTTGNAAYHAFLYSNGAMSDLGTLGGTYSQAWGINNNGQVVGYSDIAGNATSHAFLYSNGAMTDLGTLGGTYSAAFGINSNGQVVGGANTTGNAAYHAFLYSNGAMTDLNNLLPSGSVWTLYEARGINDLGQIVGWGAINAQTHAYLLTPVTSAYNVCPLYDQTKAVHSGAVIPIKLYLCDANGNDISSASIVVHATDVSMVSAIAPGVLEDAGNANPDNDFRYDSTLGPAGGYIFNLKTTGMSGTYNLNFTAGSDPTVHSVQFQAK